MKTLIRTVVTAALVLGTIGSALADCYYNGRAYPSGTRLGDRVCAPDGQWRRG
jgi:hypothetical protein